MFEMWKYNLSTV